MRALEVPLHVRLRALVLAVTLSLVAAGLSACTIAPSDTSASGKVGAQGFSLSLGDVRVTAAATVAAKDTPVVVSHEKSSLSSVVGSTYVKSGGSPIKITLGKGQQPKSPITLRFKVAKSALPKTSLVFAVLSRSEGSSRVSVIPATYDSKTGYVTATTTHLSVFDWIYSTIGSVLDVASKATTSWFDLSFPAPDPCSLDANLNGGIYTTFAVAGVFPCLSVKGNKVQVALHSSKGVPMTLQTDPSGITGSNDEVVTQVDDLANRTVAQLVHKALGASVLFGGETVTYSFDNDKPLRSIKVSDAFITMTTMYVAKVFEAIILDKLGKGEDLAAHRIQAASMLSSVVQCFRDQFSASQSDDKARTVGLVLKGMTACAGGLPGIDTVVSLAALLPSVVGNAVTLIADEITQNKTGNIQIRQIAAPVTKVAPSDYSIKDWSTGVEFDSPSHNIECLIFDGSPEYQKPFWNCFIHKYTFKDPPKPADCQYHPANATLGKSKYGGLFYGLPGARATGGGEVKYTCYGGDQIYTLFTGPSAGNYRALPSGATISDLGVTCKSSTADGETISCSNSISGASFSVSSSRFSITPPTK